jgi:hypothetical protein
MRLEKVPAGSAVRVHIQYDCTGPERVVAHQGNVMVDDDDEDMMAFFETRFKSLTGLDPSTIADMVQVRLGGRNGMGFAATALPTHNGECLLRVDGNDIVLTSPGEQALSSMPKQSMYYKEQ